MPVPLLDLQAQYATIREEVRTAVDRVLESQYFILGPEVEALEAEVAAYSQCHYGIGVSSGTDALLVALMAIDIQPGDEVITTPYTFFATAGSIVRLGAKPVFVDIDPSSYNIDHTLIEAAITPKTKAIMPVHLFGQMAEMDPIMEIANRHNLYVIEDAAQAIGAEYKGRRAGSIGHMGCFSFFPSKNLGGVGDGGMVVCQDRALADKLKLLRGHGAKPKYFHQLVGGNFRLDAIQAAVLRVKLKYLDTWSAARQRNAGIYRHLFARGADKNRQLKGTHNHGNDLNLALMTNSQNPSLPIELPSRRHIYNQFIIRTAQQAELIKHLQAKWIGCEVYYPQPMHLQKCFADLGYQPADFTQSQLASQETLAIPIYPELTLEMQQTVVESVQSYYQATHF
jgi:dTDP-4-amino-4,6-dideoxygalactose transaminase